MGGQNIKRHTGRGYAELARLKEGPARDTPLGGIPLTRVSVLDICALSWSCTCPIKSYKCHITIVTSVQNMSDHLKNQNVHGGVFFCQNSLFLSSVFSLYLQFILPPPSVEEVPMVSFVALLRRKEKLQKRTKAKHVMYFWRIACVMWGGAVSKSLTDLLI